MGFFSSGFLRLDIRVLVDGVGVLGPGAWGCSTVWPAMGRGCRVIGKRWVGDAPWLLSLESRTRGRHEDGAVWVVRSILGGVDIWVHVCGHLEGRGIGAGRSLVESSGRWSRLVLRRAMGKGVEGCWSAKGSGVLLFPWTGRGWTFCPWAGFCPETGRCWPSVVLVFRWSLVGSSGRRAVVDSSVVCRTPMDGR